MDVHQALAKGTGYVFTTPRQLLKAVLRSEVWWRWRGNRMQDITRSQPPTQARIQ